MWNFLLAKINVSRVLYLVMYIYFFWMHTIWRFEIKIQSGSKVVTSQYNVALFLCVKKRGHIVLTGHNFWAIWDFIFESSYCMHLKYRQLAQQKMFCVSRIVVIWPEILQHNVSFLGSIRLYDIIGLARTSWKRPSNTTSRHVGAYNVS